MELRSVATGGPHKKARAMAGLVGIFGTENFDKLGIVSQDVDGLHLLNGRQGRGQVTGKCRDDPAPSYAVG